MPELSDRTWEMLMSELKDIKKGQETIHLRITDVKKDVGEGFKVTNGRLRKLEVWRSFIVGGLTVIVFLIGVYMRFYN